MYGTAQCANDVCSAIGSYGYELNDDVNGYYGCYDAVNDWEYIGTLYALPL